jgi:hypothetical protein
MLHPSLRFRSGMAPPISNRCSIEIEMKKKKRKAHRSTDESTNRCIEKENVVRPHRNPLAGSRWCYWEGARSPLHPPAPSTGSPPSTPVAPSVTPSWSASPSVGLLTETRYHACPYTFLLGRARAD